jgi:hypothetical protein
LQQPVGILPAAVDDRCKPEEDAMDSRSQPEVEVEIIGGTDRDEERRRLARTVVLVVAVGAALAAGPAVAAHLTTPNAGTNGRYPRPGLADTACSVAAATAPENANQREGRIPTPAGEAYLQRPAFVTGKVMLIRIRADAANVREDRGITALDR